MGLPAAIRVDQIDQGTEFVSRDLDLWAYQRGVSPGQESQPTMIHSSVQRRFRAECLSAHWFLSLADGPRRSRDDFPRK